MAKEKKELNKESIKEISNDIYDLLHDNMDASANEASNIFEIISNQVNNYVTFSRGISDVRTWIEENRIIYGRKFSYEDASFEMILGEKDEKIKKAPRPYLTQYINDKTKDKTVIKCRQCKDGNTVVKIKENEKIYYKTIKQLFDEKYTGQIYYLNKNKEKFCNVKDVWKSGIKQLYQIELKNGYRIKMTLEDKIWSKEKNKFIYVKDLKKGDFLTIENNSFGKINNKRLAILCGYFFSDGTTYRNQKGNIISNFRNKNQKYIDEFIKYSGSDTRLQKHDCSFVFIHSNNYLKSKLIEWNIFGLKKKEKTIPEEIMNMNKESLRLFINRLFAGDGYFHIRIREKWKTTLYESGILRENIVFLLQLQKLLYKFKIKSYIKKDGKHFRLMIKHDYDNVLLFAKEIGIYDKITKEIIKNIKKNIKDANSRLRGKRHFNNYQDNQIIKIKKAEKIMTYDLAVSDKKNHNFFANGICVSNSEFSETEINDNIYLCVSRPFTNVRHIFPTAGMANQIAKEKISGAIEKSPKIAEHLKKPYNLTSKNFKNGSFYTVDSSWTDYQGRGPSSDKLVFDEYESQNPQIEDIFSESTSHSEIGMKTRISTPKFPNSGIDGMYQKGCQYKWFVTCPKCKKEQEFTFPDNIINFFDINTMDDMNTEDYQKKANKVYIGCKFCSSYINRVDEFYLANSRWMCEKPFLFQTRASYRVNYMMLPWKTGKEILIKYHSFKYVNQFWNEVMGVAFISKEAQISRDIFEQCQDLSFSNSYQAIGQARNVSVGVDWGTVSWVVVRANGFNPDVRKCKVIYIERIDTESLRQYGYAGIQTDHAKRVGDIADFFHAKIIVNDANGIGIDRNAYLIKKYPTRAWGCFYDTNENEKQKHKENLIIPKWSNERRTVTVSRLGTFRELFQEYEEKKIWIPRIDPIVEIFIKHHSAMAIERYEDEKTGTPYEVVGSTGPDHLAHADVYSKIGFDYFVNNVRKTTLGVINGSDNSDDIYKKIDENTNFLG